MIGTIIDVNSKNNQTMRRLFLLTIIFVITSCSYKTVATSNKWDDVYYTTSSEKDESVNDSSVTEDVSTTSSEGDTYITNNYYDYSYSSRIRRFYHSSFYSYYSDYYTNVYWYDYDPHYYGNSIYLSWNWLSPTPYMTYHPFGWGHYGGWVYPWNYYYSWNWYNPNYYFSNGWYNDSHCGHNYYENHEHRLSYYTPRASSGENHRESNVGINPKRPVEKNSRPIREITNQSVRNETRETVKKGPIFSEGRNASTQIERSSRVEVNPRTIIERPSRGSIPRNPEGPSRKFSPSSRSNSPSFNSRPQPTKIGGRGR